MQHPHSLEALEAWLATRDPEEEYNFMDTNNCLAAQYRRHIGEPYTCKVCCDPFSPLRSLPFDVALETVGVGANPGTFGGAIEYLREYKDRRPGEAA